MAIADVRGVGVVVGAGVAGWWLGRRLRGASGFIVCSRSGSQSRRVVADNKLRRRSEEDGRKLLKLSAQTCDPYIMFVYELRPDSTRSAIAC